LGIFEPTSVIFSHSSFSSAKQITILSLSLSLSKMEKHNTMTSPPSQTATTIVTFRELVRRLTGSSAVSEELPVNPTSNLFLKAFPHGGLTGPRWSPYTNQGTAGMRKLEPDTPVQTPPSNREPDPKKNKKIKIELFPGNVRKPVGSNVIKRE
jgi:hypothetical protein